MAPESGGKEGVAFSEEGGGADQVEELQIH